MALPCLPVLHMCFHFACIVSWERGAMTIQTWLRRFDISHVTRPVICLQWQWSRVLEVVIEPKAVAFVHHPEGFFTRFSGVSSPPVASPCCPPAKTASPSRVQWMVVI
ncbi:hypothetical protein DOTSEDRAFT_74164 [Dothistroma septosporum NZE10]|uniref:Secreted protein n=1 Tax=Dothistroma septosporum (strain NZE10 / CBS 128990) TaxID=675120 RepID=N1PEG0_DOTSN|nr:hypothetical protein DOTSEDRAFT_74164 [Dothistroma septosporum NZE10]